jgi:hypothetical protein
MSTLPLAAVGQPLFGNVWLALLAVLAAIALLLAVVMLVGYWLAATHPEPPPEPAAPPTPVEPPALSPELLAIIACAVNVTVGPRARVKAIEHVHAPSVEALMLQWSLEGRRQIYTSHKVR